MKNVLVTGTSGFIGSKLLDVLSRLDDLRVYPLSRNAKYNQNISKFLVPDPDNEGDLGNALPNKGVLIHLAGLAHVSENKSNNFNIVDAYIESNIDLTRDLIRLAYKNGVKRFIFISSANVSVTLGGNELLAYSSYKLSPSLLTGITKLEAERDIIQFATSVGMEYVIIRPPLVYGEGVKANFASLMKLVGKGFPLPFRAINQNKRSLVSVYNLVDLIKVCIDHPKAANQVFLVSDDDDLSTAQMVALMAKVQGKVNLSLPVPVWCFKLAGKLFKKEDVVDRLVGSLQLDIEHTKKTLDWVPPYSVEHGFVLAAKKKD